MVIRWRHPSGPRAATARPADHYIRTARDKLVGPRAAKYEIDGKWTCLPIGWSFQIKEKNKQEDKPPFFDLNSLKSRTIQSIMISSALIATGLYTPLIYLASFFWLFPLIYPFSIQFTWSLDWKKKVEMAWQHCSPWNLLFVLTKFFLTIGN